MTHPVVHWEIGGHSLPALSDFYAKAFGWKIDEADENYCLVHPADGGLGGGLMQTHDQMPPYVTIYVQVDNLEEELKTIAGLGGTMLMPPTAINDNASFALFQDPAGNIVGLLRTSEPINSQPAR
ncbi:VOC family protein [Actinoplanes sp. NPDC024001]|uniref:VOC family protein n=1 Tax=Actinoplanes sp. NPDC024001 TaxID=3154598 RepID=UPI0033DD48D6